MSDYQENTDSFDWPLAKFAFKVNMGYGYVAFETMDGLGASVEKMEFRDGNSVDMRKKFRPTITTYDPVTLKKGVFSGQKDLYSWFKSVRDMELFADPRTITIELCEVDAGGSMNTIFMWTLESAYVTKFTPPSLDAGDDGGVAVEEIEISYEHFTMA